MNKDLVLREKLALERTVMANQRTFLSFLRTSLYFSIAGLTIAELIVIKNKTILVVVFFTISFLLLLTGIFSYFNQRRKIQNSRKQIGGNIIDDEADL